MKKPIYIIAGIVIVFGIVGLISIKLSGDQTCYTQSRLKLVPDENGLSDAYFIQNQPETVSNLLCRSDTRNSLARQCNVSETGFRLTRIGSVRGTWLIYIEYAGTVSNRVFCVASNAAIKVAAFYSTNQPTWKATYIETFNFTPRSYWQTKLDDLHNFISRFR